MLKFKRKSTFPPICACLILLTTVAGALRCPNCHICPIDKPGCCFLDNGTVIENFEEVVYDNDGQNQNNCVDTKCVNGKLTREYHCPLGYHGIGTACYLIGMKPLTFYDAERYCEQLGHAWLAVFDTKEKATSLEGQIDQYLPRTKVSDNKGLVWLGTNSWNDGLVTWFNGKTLQDTYSNLQTLEGTKDDHVSAYSIQHHSVDYHWYLDHRDSLLSPLCQRTYCERVPTCKYKGAEYNPGEIIWKDPKCKCTWMECGENGQVKAVTKPKPCCTYKGSVYGDGETVTYETCFIMVCEKGKLTSYPSCSSPSDARNNFFPVTYNGSASCYMLSDHEMTFNEARRFCALQNGKLAEITSLGENEAVENYAINMQRYGDMWLGARADLCHDGKLGQFHWTSPESLERPVEAVYQEYCEGQPSKNGGNNCLFTTFTKERSRNYWCWASASCKQKKFALCEKCSQCEQISTIVEKKPATTTTTVTTTTTKPTTTSSSASSSTTSSTTSSTSSSSSSSSTSSSSSSSTSSTMVPLSFPLNRKNRLL